MIYVKEGRSATFTCKSEIDTKWAFNGRYLPSNADKLGNTLTISNVDNSNKGRYECHGRTEKSEEFISQAILKITGV